LFAQHRGIEPCLQHIELLAFTRGVARPCRATHLFDPLRLCIEQLAGAVDVCKLRPDLAHFAPDQAPAIQRHGLHGGGRLLHALACQVARVARCELLADAQLQHRHFFRSQAERIRRHVAGTDAQLRVHQLALHHGTLAHRLGLGGHLAQHRVAFERNALSLREGHPLGCSTARQQCDEGEQCQQCGASKLA
jgi:hypothetical protein